MLREVHVAPVAEVQVWAAVGSADEAPGEGGLAHFHEHMLFKGTEGRGVGEITAAVEEDDGIDGIIFLATYASANLALVKTMRHHFKEKRSSKLEKPLIACFAAPPAIWWEDIRAMDKEGMVVLPTPERAARAMGALWRVSHW